MSAGYLNPADAAERFTATVDVSSAETAAQLRRLEETADELASSIVPDLASNVKLVWVCMQALPQILTGERCWMCHVLQFQLFLSHWERTLGVVFSWLWRNICKVEPQLPPALGVCFRPRRVLVQAR